MSDGKDDTQPPRDDLRQCSTCRRKVPSNEGVYVGGGRWCCFACAAELYYEDDEELDED
jgi:hypothetical protein